MPPVGFETTILVSERPQTHALDRTATGIGKNRFTIINYSWNETLCSVNVTFFKKTVLFFEM
jgi:hypothetical protein